MSCYNPMVRVEDTFKWETAADGHRYHPATIISGEKYLEQFDRKIYGTRYKSTLIPCGNCIGCRLDYSRNKANQGYLESLCWKDNYFVTLTISDDYLIIPDEMTSPEKVKIYQEGREWKKEISGGITYTNPGDWNGHLIKKSIQLFMKRLRKKMKKEYNANNIRFIECGEYGETNGRPHYHLIIFNCPLPVETFYNPRLSWGKDYYYQNTVIEDCWEYGYSNITDANWNNIAYVSRYITKKIKGDISGEHYAALGQTPEFLTMSNRPGLGYYYYEKHKNEIYELDSIPIKNKSGISYIKPPKYFDILYEREEPEKFEKVKALRRKEQITNEQVKDTLTSVSRYQRYQINKRTKENKTAIFKRDMREL